MSKNHLIRNFLCNGRMRINGPCSNQFKIEASSSNFWSKDCNWVNKIYINYFRGILSWTSHDLRTVSFLFTCRFNRFYKRKLDFGYFHTNDHLPLIHVSSASGQIDTARLFDLVHLRKRSKNEEGHPAVKFHITFNTD